MVDYYEVLGVARDASAEDIKRAFRKRALQHHPDTSDVGKSSAERFHEIQEAYHVLRDEGRRRQYDAMLRGGWGGAEEESAYRGPWGQPGVDSKDFDSAFDAWFKRMSEQMKDFEDERVDRERCTAERMARAAAWELEKEEAKLNRVRTERLKRRAEDARHARHAATLRRFWQTHHGVTRMDLVFLGGLALVWRAHLRKAASSASVSGLEQQAEGQLPPLQQHDQVGPMQQRATQQQQPSAARAAVGAVAAATAAAGQPP